jgi:predicted nucleotide-binding protein
MLWGERLILSALVRIQLFLEGTQMAEDQRWKIFIASSGKAKKLAQALDYLLREMDSQIDSRPWSYDSFHVAGNTLKQLLSAAQTSDFAVVLLTKDDTVIQGRADKNLILDVPRDNCIFELGLFTGALGLDKDEKTRCFMVAAVEENALPSDLKGYTYLSFDQPNDLTDWEQCKDAVRPISMKLVDAVRKAKRYYRPSIPLLSLDELLRREGALDLKRGSEVVVHSEKPQETRYQYASLVRENMKRGITYHYFFDLDPNGAIEIVYLIRTLAVIDVKFEQDWESINENERLKILEDNRPTIEANLDEIKRHVKIHMLPYKVSEAFCIHNAAAANKQEKCYLRWYDRANFIEIPDHDTAHTKYEAYKNFRHNRPTVFGDSLKDLNRKLKLADLFEDNFPKSLMPVLRNKCFPEAGRPQSKGGRNQSGPLRRGGAKKAARPSARA